MSVSIGSHLGPYEIVEQLGRGGMATVYKAYQGTLARYVAVKVLPTALAEEPGLHLRFQQEAVAIARLRHPHILAVYDYGDDQGVPYLVMEFVDGGTLADQLGALLPVNYVVRMLAPVASALDYAHAMGVLHRDVKPANVLLRHDGTPILSDFGIARLMNESRRLTMTGAVVGTPTYMSPEQALGEAIGPAVDQYALAVVAFEMLTGKTPFSSDTPMAVLAAHVTKPIPSPRSFNPALDDSVEVAMLKGLAKRPEERYGSVSEFVQALSRADRRSPSSVSLPTVRRVEPEQAVRSTPTPPPLSVATPDATPLPAADSVPDMAPNDPPSPPPSVVRKRPASRFTRRRMVVAAACAVPTVVALGAVGIWQRSRSDGTRGKGSAGSASEASLKTARAWHSATLLPDGKILIVGGRDDRQVLSTAELYDPATQLSSPTSPISSPRYRHTATLLPSGKVLIAGGQASDTDFVATAERYDPATKMWTSAGSMSVTRSQHTATLMDAGGVLVVGGFNASTYHATADLYDGATNTWRSVGPMHTPRSQHATVALPKDTALAIGGFASAEMAVERFDGATSRWTVAPSLATGRLGHTATLLGNGRVVVAGGDSAERPGAYVSEAEQFDLGANSWSSAGNLGQPRLGHTATLAPGGALFVIAGKTPTTHLATVERYDAKANRWVESGKLVHARWQHTATQLTDGRILVVGGQDNQRMLASIEWYDPNGAAGAGKTLTLELRAVGNSGVNGTATLTELPNGTTRVAVTVVGAGAGPQPVHIHDGWCAGGGATRVHTTLSPSVNGRSMTEINSTIDQLLASPAQLHLHRSQDELGVIITCADIKMP